MGNQVVEVKKEEFRAKIIVTKALPKEVAVTTGQRGTRGTVDQEESRSIKKADVVLEVSVGAPTAESLSDKVAIIMGTIEDN